MHTTQGREVVQILSIPSKKSKPRLKIERSRVVRKNFVTLIEMMIVMFLIALIIGVVGYNYRGSLEEGKAFKTKTAIEKISTILNLDVAEHPEDLDDIESRWEEIIRKSPLVSDPGALTRDGWGEKYEVTVEDGRIFVRSRKYEQNKQASERSR